MSECVFGDLGDDGGEEGEGGYSCGYWGWGGRGLPPLVPLRTPRSREDITLRGNSQRVKFRCGQELIAFGDDDGLEGVEEDLEEHLWRGLVGLSRGEGEAAPDVFDGLVLGGE